MTKKTTTSSSVARITQVTYSRCYHHSNSHDNGDFNGTNISINQSNDVDVSATNKVGSSKATVTQGSTVVMGRSSTDE
jgi:ABC-type antimicrobial peptide transport system permease subunit